MDESKGVDERINHLWIHHPEIFNHPRALEGEVWILDCPERVIEICKGILGHPRTLRLGEVFLREINGNTSLSEPCRPVFMDIIEYLEFMNDTGNF